jgi:hypothetical protein
MGDHLCIVMLDSWTDGKEKSIINFLVNCPKGTMFTKFINAFAYVKDAQLLCELLDRLNREVGPQYVVQVITNNATNYIATSKLPREIYQTLYWTPCATHCIDFMLANMGKFLGSSKSLNRQGVSPNIYIYIYLIVLKTKTGTRTKTGNEPVKPVSMNRFFKKYIKYLNFNEKNIFLRF